MQDIRSPHNSEIITEYLNTKFPTRWIGTRGLERWPPRLRCLNPLNYFLWGYLKNMVYGGSNPKNIVCPRTRDVFNSMLTQRHRRLEELTNALPKEDIFLNNCYRLKFSLV